MMKKRRLLFTLPIFAITLIAVFMLFLAPQPARAAFGPFNPLPDQIVPKCNLTLRSGDQITGLGTICTFCDFLTLIQNILNYTWWLITPIVIVIALIWGGALMFISSAEGSVTQAQRGKKIIFNTLIGFVLVFGAWLIIDTVIKILGGKIGSNTATAPFGPWNKIECIAPVVSTTLPPPLPPPIPPEVITTTGSAAICSKIRTNSRISYGSEDCKELLSTERVGAKRTIDDCASSQSPIICENGCNDKAVCKREPSVTINPKMLAALDILGQERAYTLSSITTGSHSPASCHYGGACVDVYVTPRTKDSMEVLRKRMRTLGASSAICETKEINPTTGKNYFDTCDAVPNSFNITHVHAQFP